jgi:polysaccharide export outer membrane protein
MRETHITRVIMYSVLAFACCIAQRELGTTAQAQQSETTAKQAGTVDPRSTGGVDGNQSPALTGVRRPLYRLRKSDVVEIGFTFSPQFDQTVMVQPDGFIPLKGAELLYVEGETVLELRDSVLQAYMGVLHDPQVTIALKDFDKPFFIAAGEVGHPGKYELRADTTVIEAVAIAGGFTPRAKHSQVVLFRRVSDEIVESHLLNAKSILKSRNLAEDMHLQPGDLLFVPQNLISKIRQYMPTSNLSMYASPTQF